MGHFDYQETKLHIVKDIRDALKDKGYDVENPIRIPEDDSESTAVSINAYDDTQGINYSFCLRITELRTYGDDTLTVIGYHNESGAGCRFDDWELGIDSLSAILDFVEELPEISTKETSGKVKTKLSETSVWTVLWRTFNDGETITNIKVCGTLAAAKSEMEGIIEEIRSAGHFAEDSLKNGWITERSEDSFEIRDTCDDYWEEVKIEKHTLIVESE